MEQFLSVLLQVGADALKTCVLCICVLLNYSLHGFGNYSLRFRPLLVVCYDFTYLLW